MIPKTQQHCLRENGGIAYTCKDRPITILSDIEI